MMVMKNEEQKIEKTIAGKTVVITGGTGVLGKAIAAHLAE